MNYPSETIEAITRFLFIGDSIENLRKSDLVIVLGNHLADLTIQELKHLQTAGIITGETKLLFSGNVGKLDRNDAPEAEILFQLALKQGFSKENLITEAKSCNTYENFLFSKTRIDNLGGFKKFNSILCIGQAFLLRRAKMCAAKCGYPHDEMMYYGIVDKYDRNISPDAWWKNEAARRRVIEELGRISTYTLKGDLSID